MFNSDFYLKPLNNEGFATWHSDTDPKVHDLLDGIIDEEVKYSRYRNYDGKYQDCKVVKENGELFMYLGDFSKYSVKKVSENNKIKDEIAEHDNDKCIICCEYKKNHVLIPCGHIISCTRCTNTMKTNYQRCPLCKVLYTQSLRVFY